MVVESCAVWNAWGRRTFNPDKVRTVGGQATAVVSEWRLSIGRQNWPGKRLCCRGAVASPMDELQGAHSKTCTTSTNELITRHNTLLSQHAHYATF